MPTPDGPDYCERIRPDSDDYCTYKDLKRYLAGDTLQALGIEPLPARITHGLRVYPFRTLGALLHLAWGVRGVPTMVVSLVVGACIPFPLAKLAGLAGFTIGAVMLACSDGTANGMSQ